MLKYFTDDRSDGDPPVIVEITFITLLVLDYWHNGAPLKLLGNLTMDQHGVEETTQTVK